MKHVKALIIKFAMSAVVLGMVFTGIYNYAFSDIILIGLVLTVVATISDLILSFLVIWIMGASFFGNTIPVIQATVV
ncbi:MAG: DUF2512 family protein, partial [Priestia megaterium]